MTLSGMMKLALRQLDELPEDISEYDELFRSYANMGYMIAARLFYRPRETFTLRTDETGRAELCALPIERVIEARDGAGKETYFELSADGQTIRTPVRGGEISLLCEVRVSPMTADSDEPRLPRYVHPALADYICYRHLSSGSLAKQRRAEFFYQSFYQQMRMLRTQGAGSITRQKNLYSATEVSAYGKE